MTEKNMNECKCSEITVYTEDFCTCTCRFKKNCNPGADLVADCSGCNGFVNFFKWLFDKSPDKKPFF